MEKLQINPAKINYYLQLEVLAYEKHYNETKELKSEQYEELYAAIQTWNTNDYARIEWIMVTKVSLPKMHYKIGLEFFNHTTYMISESDNGLKPDNEVCSYEQRCTYKTFDIFKIKE